MLLCLWSPTLVFRVCVSIPAVLGVVWLALTRPDLSRPASSVSFLADELPYTSTGNRSSCCFYSEGVNLLMQLQFLAPVELFFKQLNGYSS